MMKEISVTRRIPVVGSYDIVVCGGGPSGWVAAVAAARSGCRTALIERYGFFGGTATAGLVVPISGFYKNEERVVGGIAWEFVQQMLAAGAAQIEFPKGHISVDTEYYKLIAQRMVLDAGVEVFCNSYLSGAAAEDGKITAVFIENKNGSEALAGSCFIDATGDGDLCAAAGIPMRTFPVQQPLSLCFELVGVDVDTPLLRDSIHHDGKGGRPSCNAVIRSYLAELYGEGRAPVFGGPWFNTLLRGGRLAVNLTRNGASVLDNRAYSEAECRLREDMFSLVELLREGFPEFRNCTISSSAVNAGVREGRHLDGLYLLTGEELLAAVDFPDSIARAAHPMDLHRPGGIEQTLTAMPQAGHIPYRSLISPACGNLLAAGRLISADEAAHASIRVQGTAMAIGEAAGSAAALCAGSGRTVFSLDAAVLRTKLITGGAVV